MPTYYTKFSVVVPLPDQGARDYSLALAQQAIDAHLIEDLPPDFPAELKEAVEEWWFGTEADPSPAGCGVWLRSDDGGVEAACRFIQHLLQRFNPAGRVAFEWSYDCSKPRLDAYGGGAAVITAREIRSMNTGRWLEEQGG